MSKWNLGLEYREEHGCAFDADWSVRSTNMGWTDNNAVILLQVIKVLDTVFFK